MNTHCMHYNYVHCSKTMIMARTHIQVNAILEWDKQRIRWSRFKWLQSETKRQFDFSAFSLLSMKRIVNERMNRNKKWILNIRWQTGILGQHFHHRTSIEDFIKSVSIIQTISMVSIRTHLTSNIQKIPYFVVPILALRIFYEMANSSHSHNKYYRFCEYMMYKIYSNVRQQFCGWRTDSHKLRVHL